MHPANVITEREVVEFRDMIQNSLKDRKAQIEAAEKRPPVPKPARKCKNCGLPLNLIADCSKHAIEMRNFRTEFDYGCNWSDKLSDAIAEEFRLEEREKELLSVAESLKGKRDEDSRVKFLTIMGQNFKSKVTEDTQHQNGLLDVVRERLSVIRANMPTLVRAADAYLQEQNQVPTEGQIFQQRHRDEKAARILQ